MSASTLFAIWILVWAVCGVVAGAIANERDRSFLGWAAVTFFILGPFGPGFALVATHGRIERARLDKLDAIELEASRGASRLTEEDRPTSAAAPKTPAANQSKTMYCPACGYKQDVPEGKRSFKCGDCDQVLKVSAITN